MKRIDALLVVSLFWHYTNDGGKVQVATLYKSINVLQNPCWAVLKKYAVSAMIEIQKRRTTAGRLLLHMLGDLTAHVGSRAVISLQSLSQYEYDYLR